MTDYCNTCHHLILDENNYEIEPMTVWFTSNTGFQNLKTHVLNNHKNWTELLISDDSQPLATSYVIQQSTDKAASIYGWLDWIVSEQKPFSNVEKDATRKYSWLKSIILEVDKAFLKAKFSVHAKVLGIN
ncbi:hypothetical protein GEMRC1_000914 [Eukaryota sp. GEM-RC1]